jgi:hypothetical protein
MSSLDPHYDWSQLTNEQVGSFVDAFKTQVERGTELGRMIESDDGGDLRSAIGAFAESNVAIGQMLQHFMQEVFVLPRLVHVAGPRLLQPDGSLNAVCERCGSTLARWAPGLTAVTSRGLVHVSPDDVLPVSGDRYAKPAIDDAKALRLPDGFDISTEPSLHMCVALPRLDGVDG